jgi:hypothetical protein
MLFETATQPDGTVHESHGQGQLSMRKQPCSRFVCGHLPGGSIRLAQLPNSCEGQIPHPACAGPDRSATGRAVVRVVGEEVRQ